MSSRPPPGFLGRHVINRWRTRCSHRHGNLTGTFNDAGNTITGQSQLSRDGTDWKDGLAITYRRSSNPKRLDGNQPDLNAMARRVIGAHHYMTLATTYPDRRPALSPCSTPRGATRNS
jgi:hypothetical protein